MDTEDGNPGAPAGSLTASELAALAAVPEPRIAELTRSGVLVPAKDGSYARSDIQRIEVASAYERAGIAVDLLAIAIQRGRMSFEFTDRIYPEASPPSGRTLVDLVAELGPAGDRLPDVLLAFGLSRATPDRPLTVADEIVLRAFVEAWSRPPLAADALVRAARILGDSTRRAARGSVDLFVEAVAMPPELTNRLTLEELRPRLFDPAIDVSKVLEPTLLWVLRQHLVQALNGANVEAMERALEIDGVRPRADRHPPAIAFVDLTGFTRLTDELGDAPALGHAERLAHLAADIAVAHGGTLVKQLGDGVMLVFDAPASAVAAALALRAAAAATDLPPLHTGIAAGPIIERDGDYFGRTVILASRLSGVAGPGEVVLEATAAAAAGDVPLVALGEHGLKGFATPVAAFRVDGPPD
jgi:adenylate cyclase